MKHSTLYRTLRTKFSDLNLRKKFMAILALFSVVILLLFTLCYHLLANAYDNVTYKSFAANLNFTGSSIQNRLKQTETLSFMILSSSLVQNSLTQLDSSYESASGPTPQVLSATYNTLSSFLTNLYESNRSNVEYLAIQAGDNLYSTNYGALGTDESILTNAVSEAKQAGGSPVWTFGSPESGLLYCVREIRQIDDLTLDDLGTIIIALNTKQLLSESSKMIQTFGQYNSFLKYNGQIRSNLSDEATEIPEKIQEMSPGEYDRFKSGHHDYFAACSSIPGFSDFTLGAFIPYDTISQNLYRTVILVFCVMFFGVFCLLTLTDQLIDSILVHIDRLIAKIRAFSKQTPPPKDLPDYTNRKDEIGILHRQFDDMTTQITTLIDQNYKSEILYREAQIHALERQINPHFLYNTLDTIYWKAQLTGNEDISLMAQSLGQMLRATLSSNRSLIPLKDELALIRAYINIQEIRYNNRLVFSFSIEEQTKEALIPTLSLQPLVENAIKYGLEEVIGTCHIALTTEKEGNELVCKVSNDGSVFAPDLLQTLQKRQDALPKERQGHGFGIGLLNINKRIQLLFGKESGLILTNEGRFATAIIRIPYQTSTGLKEQSKQVKQADSSQDGERQE